MKKILHIITHLGFGGASDNTLLTVESLSREKYQVDLVTGQDYTDWDERGEKGADAFFRLPDLRRDPHPAADVRVLGQLTSLIKAGGYDVVHTHNAKAGIIGRIAAKRAGVPVILHTYHLLSWQDAQVLDGSPWQRAVSGVKGFFYFQLERYAASLSNALVCVCEHNKHEAIAQNLAAPDKFTTIYSGIDLARFQITIDRAEKCRSLGLDPDQPIVGMIGRLSPQKAPLDFVQAAKLVLERNPHVQFIMVGDGPLAAEVAYAIGDESRIKVLGYRDDVPELYGILDVFALSSHWEGLGRALTEAMIMGIPSAATDVNGIPELITHQETGLLSPAHDPARLAENISWLVEHPQEAARMSDAAHAHVLPKFDVKQMVNQIDTLYERLLSTPGHQSRLTPAMPSKRVAA